MQYKMSHFKSSNVNAWLAQMCSQSIILVKDTLLNKLNNFFKLLIEMYHIYLLFICTV